MRKPITVESEIAAFEAFKKAVKEVKSLRGSGTFSSRHEILGILADEYHQLTRAVQNYNSDDFEVQLLDILATSFLGIASIKNKSLDY